MPSPSPSPAAPQPSASAKAAVDNRAVQMNPNNATYHQSRGDGTRQAAASAQAAARTSNPTKKA